MRKEYSKALKQLFRNRLRKIALEFDEIKIKNPVYSGQSSYLWVPNEGLACFILLVPNPKGDDTYTIEVGWSTSGQLPIITEGSWITNYQLTSDHKEFDQSVCVLRLGSIYMGKDIWWTIGDQWDVTKLKLEDYMNQKPLSKEEAIKDVENSLDEAFSLLVEHGINLLKKVVEHKGRS